MKHKKWCILNHVHVLYVQSHRSFSAYSNYNSLTCFEIIFIIIGDNDDDEDLEIHCLGRPIEVGSFYDSYKDQISTNLAIGTEAVCEEKLQKRIDIEPIARVNIITDDSFDSKCKVLNIGRELQLSLLTGLVQPEGASQYLCDFNFISNNARVTLQYRCITNVATISPKLLHNIRGRTIEGATHVVSEVHYGFEAFFVFDKHIDDGDDINATIEKLEKAIRERSDNGIGKIYCTPYCDFKHHAPRTITDVIHFCNNLKALFNDGKIESKPVKAKLSSLRGSPTKQLLDAKLKDDLKNILMYLKAASMIDIPYNGIFDKITYKFVKLKQYLSEYEEILKNKVIEILPHVRADHSDHGKQYSEALQELLQKHHSSPFSQERIEKWIEKQKQEMKEYLDLVHEGKIIIVSVYVISLLYY